MKSKIIQQDHDDLVRLSKSMTPQERLVAFFNHLRLMAEVHQKGLDSRKHPSLKSSRKQPRHAN